MAAIDDHMKKEDCKHCRDILMEVISPKDDK